MTCEWAGCSRQDTTLVESWRMCPPHKAEHYALEATDLPNRRGPAPCGTESAYRRHLRRGESPCVPCRKAANADRLTRPAGRRRTWAVREAS